MKKEEKEQITIYPEDIKENNVVTIKYDEWQKCITLSCEKNEEIRLCVKEKGYRWGQFYKRWEYNIKADETTKGTIKDRMVEIGNTILLLGYPVQIDLELQEDCVNGNYEEQFFYWLNVVIVKERESKKYLHFVFPKDRSVFSKIINMTQGFSFEKGVACSPKLYKKTEKLVLELGFKVTPEAKLIIDEEKHLFESAKRVVPKSKTDREREELLDDD